MRKAKKSYCGDAWRIECHFGAEDSQGAALHTLAGTASTGVPARTPSSSTSVERKQIIVAGDDFGLGVGHARIVELLKRTRVVLVLARSFSPGMLQNLIQAGVPALIFLCTDEIETGDELEVDITAGDVRNFTSYAAYRVDPLPRKLRRIVFDASPRAPRTKRRQRPSRVVPALEVSCARYLCTKWMPPLRGPQCDLRAHSGYLCLAGHEADSTNRG